MSAGAGQTRSRRALPITAGELVAPGYEVIEHLRRGNDLDVYDVWSVERRSRCVVKALRGDRLDRERSRQMLIDEGVLLSRLSHPHIVRAYETLTEPRPLIVLETLGGETLSHLIDRDGPGETEAIAHLGLHLGSAIHYLHHNGVLHLDLKPSNVIAEAGRAKLIDLSLARPPGEAHAGIGTWHYLSPEQARGGELTAAADVWGLGAVLFETATGEAPFDDDPDAWTDPETDSSDTYSDATLERYPQLERRARRPEAVRPLSSQLADSIAACLEPEPADRPALEELMVGFEHLAGLPPAERRWSARRRDAQR
ncbi:MAG: serine/threonine-protein kinase [Solirubrobacterales bacterium]